MTNFERKPGDKRNDNLKEIDPVKELTRLLGHKNLSSDWQKNTESAQAFFMQSQKNNLSKNTLNNEGDLHSDLLEINNVNYDGDAVQANHNLAAKADIDNSQWLAKKAHDSSSSNHAYENNFIQKDSRQEPFNVGHVDDSINDFASLYNEHENSHYDLGFESESRINGGDQQVKLTDELPYWDGEAHDEQGEEQIWSHPLDVSEPFLDQPLDHDKQSEPNFLLDMQPDQKQAFTDDNALYSDGPLFVDDLSQDQNNINDLLGNTDNEQHNAQPVNDLYSRQSKPYRMVTSPLVLATQPHSFLGYGQAVTTLPHEKSKAHSLKPNVPVEDSKTSIKNKVFNRGFVEKVKSKIKNAPLSEEVSSVNVTKPTANVADNMQPKVNFQAGDGFEDTLNDFNLTIKEDKKKRYRRDATIKIVRPDHNSVPETKSFDLPPIRYNDVDHSVHKALPFDQEFSDVLASGVPDAPVHIYNSVKDSEPVEDVQQSTQSNKVEVLQDIEISLSESAVDASKYNWSAVQNNAIDFGLKKRSYKKIYLLLGSLVVILVAVLGYYTLFYYDNTSSEPVIIHRDAGAIKIVPAVEPNGANNQDQTIYNHGENTAKQSELVDHSEAPVDLDKVKETQPAIKTPDTKVNDNQSSLEDSSFKASVLKVIQNSVTIHEVPTVRINGEKLSSVAINSVIANQKENILKPGENFKEYLVEQNKVQQGVSLNDMSGKSVPSSVENAKSDNSIAQLNNSVQPQANDDPFQGSKEEAKDNLASSAQDNKANSINQAYITQAQSDSRNNVKQPSQDVKQPSQDIVPIFNAPTQKNVATQSKNEASVLQTQVEAKSQAHQNNATVSQIESTLPSGVFYVQIASHPTKEAAQQSFVDIQRQFPQFNSLLDGRKVGIVAADIPGRGTYYRVRIATSSQVAASQLCNQLKNIQLSCFIGK